MTENTVSFHKSIAFIPSDVTLKKYGMKLGDWLDIYNRQNGACGICHTPFKLGHRINVDHEHVKGWKTMAPSERRQYVRGLLCYQCNKFTVMRGINAMRLWDAWLYMRAYEVRITSRNVNAGQQVVKRRDVRHTNQKKNNKHQPG